MVSLELLYGVSTGIDMTKLPELSRAVERITGIPNSPNKAVTGDLISTPDFPRRYAGLLHGETMTRTRLYPFEMEMVGRGRRQAMSYGSLSLETVKALLEHMRLSSEESSVQEVFNALKQRLDSLENMFPVMLDEHEVQWICHQVLD